MLEDIKELLIQEPQHIVNILEFYDFHKINLTRKEIRCAFDEDGNPTSICIRLIDNENLYVMDFARNISKDIFGYISFVRKVDLKEVLAEIRRELNIDSFSSYSKKKSFFGGLFDNIGVGYYKQIPDPIPESTLNEYLHIPNERFLNDGISIETQKKFGIGFSIADQRITIPIRNECGELIGVKGRCNYTPDEYEPKYLYLVPCPMSQTLYGYSENYANMFRDTVYIFESEKSVMQMDSMGRHNSVAIGSNNISEKQAQMIAALEPKNVVLMLDNSLPIENIIKDAETLRNWNVMSTFSIHYFDWRDCKTLDEKDSPTDKGEEVLESILKNNIKEYIVN